MCSNDTPAHGRGKGKTIYTLTGPCADCPFRSDKAPFLDEDRAKEIALSLESGATFYCHKTVDYDRAWDDDDSDGRGDVTGKSRACAGSLITLEKEDRPNQIMRIGERLGLYDRTRLDMDAPVYPSMREWVAAHRREGQDPDAEYCGVAYDGSCTNPAARRIDYRTVPNLDAPACTTECPGCGEAVCDACWETVPEAEISRDVYCKACRQATTDEASHHWTRTAES